MRKSDWLKEQINSTRKTFENWPQNDIKIAIAGRSMSYSHRCKAKGDPREK
jgi:hypothetical protein